ncbi:MAG: symmetrical bis(5'-nucleosyl)-tetraphosphatase [Pseudomonadales bacterium]|nr:symmetrical bis(5'-nucleosyl)-tetraphosphatase [Pseudomonadales bacterium]
MATYAVGDIQGCLPSLKCLLEKVNFDSKKDILWCAGDIINRGPACLETLRFIHTLGDSCITVLGNHDLHLLAVAFSDAELKPTDTLQAILDAPDRDTLLHWLRHRPLMHYEHGFALVHAGIHPHWSIPQALEYAHEVETVLRGDHYPAYFAQMYGNLPNRWQDDLQGIDRLRCITNYFTRMRFCRLDGQLDLTNKQGPETAKLGTIPWFEVPQRKAEHHKILFGHWASLEGHCHAINLYALDTGCVWGGQLTLLRLDDEQLFSCDCRHST